MPVDHPNRPRPKTRRPHLTPGQLITLITAVAGLINALAYLLHG